MGFVLYASRIQLSKFYLFFCIFQLLASVATLIYVFIS